MNPGQLIVLAGPMFAGKTETLISSAVRVPEDQRIVYKPVADTRHEGSDIRSHDGRVIPASFIDLSLHDAELKPCIFIDEAQFLAPCSVDKVMEMVHHGSRVVLAGLDLDYRAKPFGPMPDFMCLANTVIKLTGKCAQCSKPSCRTYRTKNLRGTILVGGAEAYEPRCLTCFQEGVKSASCSVQDSHCFV